MMQGNEYGFEGVKYCAYFFFTGWSHFSFGIHLNTRMPNIEIHVPFGFFRIGVHQLWRDFTSTGKMGEFYSRPDSQADKSVVG